MLHIPADLLNAPYCAAAMNESMPYVDTDMRDFDNMYDGCAFE